MPEVLSRFRRTRPWRRLTILAAVVLCAAAWLGREELLSPTNGTRVQRAGNAGDATTAPSTVGVGRDTPGDPTALPGRLELQHSFSWGEGPAQLGLIVPPEGLPRGPSAFDVDGRGRLYVVDPIHDAIKVFDAGQLVGRIPLSGAPRDINALEGGKVAVLRHDLTVSDLAGSRPTHIAVPFSPAILTGIVTSPDGLWVTSQDGRLAQVADALGQPLQTPRLEDGRCFTADGETVLSTRIQGREVQVTARSLADRGGKPRPWAVVGFPGAVYMVPMIAGLPDGGVAFVAGTFTGPSASPRSFLVLLAPDGLERLRLPLPALGAVNLQMWPYRLGKDGHLRFLQLEQDGARLYQLVL